MPFLCLDLRSENETPDGTELFQLAVNEQHLNQLRPTIKPHRILWTDTNGQPGTPIRLS
jgi:hypothetical protein